MDWIEVVDVVKRNPLFFGERMNDRVIDDLVEGKSTGGRTGALKKGRD